MSTIEVTITHDELIRVKKVHIQEPVEHAFARYVRHRLKDAGVPVKMHVIASTIIELEDGAGDLYWRHDDIEKSAYYRYTPKEQT